MTEKKETKHHGSVKRPHRLEMTFSEKEWQILNEIFAKSGEKSLATVCRKMVLKGGVLEQAVTPEDRRDIAKLSHIGANLWNIRKQLYDAGMDQNTLRNFQNFYDEFANIIRYFRAKIDKK